MQMPTSRRRLLRLAAALPASLPVFALALTDAPGRYAYHPVENRFGGVPDGAIVLVDEETATFSGDGFYLYPDWGTPVVYEVRATAGGLAFHYPGRPEVLWRLAGGLAGVRFSGRVEGVIDAAGLRHLAQQHSLHPLHVPELPVT